MVVEADDKWISVSVKDSYTSICNQLDKCKFVKASAAIREDLLAKYKEFEKLIYSN